MCIDGDGVFKCPGSLKHEEYYVDCNKICTKSMDNNYEDIEEI